MLLGTQLEWVLIVLSGIQDRLAAVCSVRMWIWSHRLLCRSLASQPDKCNRLVVKIYYLTISVLLKRLASERFDLDLTATVSPFENGYDVTVLFMLRRIENLPSSVCENICLQICGNLRNCDRKSGMRVEVLLLSSSVCENIHSQICGNFINYAIAKLACL